MSRTRLRRSGRPARPNICRSEPSIIRGQDVILRGMLGYVWKISQGGQARWGISYKAADIVPAGGGWSGGYSTSTKTGLA